MTAPAHTFPPSNADAIVIGAGPAGLSAAAALTAKGLDVVIFEARDRVGGRAFSLRVDGGAIDLGATWSWANEPLIATLTERLHQPTFAQYLDGDALYDTGQPGAQRLDGNPIDVPASRFTHGSQELFTALARGLPDGSLYLSQPAKSVAVLGDKVQVCVPAGKFTASHLILAVPPALAAQSISFIPELPHDIRALATRTAVWMGDMVKAVALYDRPFWRDSELSGSAISHVGPFREFHDHSGADGNPAAIFGFARASSLPPTALQQLDRVFSDQLTLIFGPKASSPRLVHVQNWNAEKWTQPASPSNDTSTFGHSKFSIPIHERIHWASTETSPAFNGHLEGALLSGARTAEHVANQFRLQGRTQPDSQNR